MRRRDFIKITAGSAMWPAVAHSQQSGLAARIGLLMMYPENDPQGQLRATVFRRELEKAGWTVGGNLQVDFHWGTGDTAWVRSAAAQVLSGAPNVMLANGDAALKAAQQSTQTVPIIFIASGDPVGAAWCRALPIRAAT
jgi:putative tryptophan/tyrosine transport system substrate-binding protein